MFKKITILMTIGCLLTAPAFASEAAKTLIQVSGSSQQEVVPDVARITVSISSVNDNLEKAKAEHTQNNNQVLAALNAQGISNEQIKTTTYQVEPIYSYEKDRLPKLKGYRVTSRLEIRTAIENAGILVNEVTSSGANEINSIRFETSDETAGKDAALRDAVADALRKADVIAAALNKRVANITLVNESGVYYHPVMQESRMLKAATADAAVPSLPAGKVTIGANVQVTVALE